MKVRTERILAVIGALCMLLCLAPTFQAEQPEGTDDLTALRSLYEAGLELERTGFPVLEENRISIREVPGEATDQADLLVVEIVPDESLEAHAADLVLQMFIRGAKECTLRQEIQIVPGEILELAFRACGEDLPAGCFRVFLMDKDDNRLSPPDQCYGTVTLKNAAGSHLEFLGAYVPEASGEETDHAPTTAPTEPKPQETTAPTTAPTEPKPQETTAPTTTPTKPKPQETTAPTEPEPQETTAPTTAPTEPQPQETEPPATDPQETDCPELPDVDPSDTPLPEELPTLPPPPETTQPITSECPKDITDDELDFED